MRLLHQKCSDPFNGHRKRITRDLRDLPEDAIEHHPTLSLRIGQRVCRNCYMKLKTTVTTEPISQPDISDPSVAVAGPSTSATSDMEYANVELCNLNATLSSIGESPIRLKRVAKGTYAKRKVENIARKIRGKIEAATGQPLRPWKDDGEEMIHQLREKFRSSSARSDKLQILTALPGSWSVRKIMTEFQTTKHMAVKSKQLAKEHGVLTVPNPKPGNRLSTQTVETVEKFYLSESVSRVMPGMKDCLSINVGGKRQLLQKRLVLCNLREAFQHFKDKHPEVKIGFTKFSILRPRQCVLAGSSGTHCVCVCTIHQNIKLLFDGARFDTVSNGEIKHYRDCIGAIQCNPPSISCFLQDCTECPGTPNLLWRLEKYMENCMIDNVEFKQWTSTDRSTLETKTQPVNEFLETFVCSLPKVMHHDFIAKQQSMFYQQARDSLEPGTFLVVADFAENYGFVVQDAIQSFHWDNQ